ncbi:OspG family effector kinase [Pseudomonas koreensis]|uniref:OspG family effector kinase n=1 Tax=Pseudomonas koreensis TaxID=198620 RepID=UPI003F854315
MPIHKPAEKSDPSKKKNHQTSTVPEVKRKHSDSKGMKPEESPWEGSPTIWWQGEEEVVKDFLTGGMRVIKPFKEDFLYKLRQASLKAREDQTTRQSKFPSNQAKLAALRAPRELYFSELIVARGSLIERAERKQKELKADFSLPYDDAKEILIASGADVNSAHVGNTVDALVSTFLIQVPRVLLAAGVGKLADLPELIEVRGIMKETSQIAKAVTGALITPLQSTFHFGARSVPVQGEFEEVSPETKAGLKVFIDNITSIQKERGVKGDSIEPDAKALEELKQDVISQYRELLEKEKVFNAINHADKIKSLETAVGVGNAVFELISRTLGHWALIGLGVPALVSMITLVTRPLLASILTVIKNRFETIAIAENVLKKFQALEQKYNANVPDNELSELAEHIQDHFQSMGQANYERLKEQVLRPKSDKLTYKLKEAEAELLFLKQKLNARTHEQFDKLEQLEILACEQNRYIEKQEEYALAFDLFTVNILTQGLTDHSLGTVAAKRMLERNLPAIIAIMASGKRDQLSELAEAYKERLGAPFWKTLHLMAEKKLNAITQLRKAHNRGGSPLINVENLEDKHFRKAFEAVKRLDDIENIKNNIAATDTDIRFTVYPKALTERLENASGTAKKAELKLAALLKEKTQYDKDFAAYVSNNISGISKKGFVWKAITSRASGAQTIWNALNGPKVIYNKVVGNYEYGKPVGWKKQISRLLAPANLVPFSYTIGVGLQRTKVASTSTSEVMRLYPEIENLLALSPEALPIISTYTRKLKPGPGLNQVLGDPSSTFASRPANTSGGREPSTQTKPDFASITNDNKRYKRLVSNVPVVPENPNSTCRIIEPSELRPLEKGTEQLEQFKKNQGWADYEVRYVHPADSSGNRRIVLRHPVSGGLMHHDISSADQAQMPALGAVGDYYAQETALQVADPDFQGIARSSLGLPENAEFKGVTRLAHDLSIRYYDPASGSEKSLRMSLETFGYRTARAMGKAGDRIDKFMSFLSLVTDGYPQDVESGIGYALNLAETVEAAVNAVRVFSGWLEKLPFSRTVGTLIKLAAYDVLKTMNKAAPVLAIVGVGLGIKSIVDLSREYPNATAPRQKAIAAELFFAVTGTVGGVAVLGTGLTGLSAAGPAGLALAIIGALGVGITLAVNHTAQTEDRMIDTAKAGVHFLKNLQSPMTVKTEGGHTTITLHRPGSVKVADGRAIFTPDHGGVQIQRVTLKPKFISGPQMPTHELVYGDYESIETFMEVNEVSAEIPETGSLAIVETSAQIKIKPVYSLQGFASKNYPEIAEFESLLETIGRGGQRRKIFTTDFNTPGPTWPIYISGLETERGLSAPTRISSNRPYTVYTADNENDLASIAIHGGSQGMTTGIPLKSTIKVSSAGGQVDVVFPEATKDKQVLSAGTPEFTILPAGLRVSRTMRVRVKTEQQVQDSARALESTSISLDYSNAIARSKTSWVTRGALRALLTRYLQWSLEILPSAALVSVLRAEIDSIHKETVDPDLLAEMNAVPKGQKMASSTKVSRRLYQLSGGDHNYDARIALETVEDLLSSRLQNIIQYGVDRDGVDETTTSEIKFNAEEDFTFSVNELLPDSVNTYAFEVKKDGSVTQSEPQMSARPIQEDPAPPLPQGFDSTLYDAGQNLGTLDTPEYVYRRHDGTFHKVSVDGAPTMEPVGTDLVESKRSTRGLLRDLTAILRWSKAQKGDIRYFQRAHFDGPAITVEPGGYLATHYTNSLRPGKNGSKTIFLHQIPTALTGFSVPDLPTQGKEQIYLTVNKHQANIRALEAKINRLTQHRNGTPTVSDGRLTFGFDRGGAERVDQLVLEQDGPLYASDNVLFQEFWGGRRVLIDFSETDMSREYNEVIQIQSGGERYFYRPKTGVLSGPLAAEGQAVVYLGLGADGQDVYGLEDTTGDLAQFTFDAKGQLTRQHRFSRKQLLEHGILDPVAGPHWITGRDGAKLRAVATPLGGDVYLLEDAHGVMHTRIKGALSWTLGLPNTVSGLEAVCYGFDVEEQAGVSLLRAHSGKAAQFVGIKTDQVSPVRVEGGGNVLLEHDFNRTLTFALSAHNPNVLELDWSQWTPVLEAPTLTGPSQSLTLINGHGGRVVIEFVQGATLSVRDIREEDFSLETRTFTTAQALAERLAKPTLDVALGTSNLGELFWDPLSKTLMAQKDGVTSARGTLSAPIRFLDAAGTHVGIYAYALGNAVELPTLGVKTYEVGLGKGNTLTLDQSFVENARPPSSVETFVYPNLETLATGEHALIKLDRSQWPNLGDEIDQTDGSVTVTSKVVPPVVLRFIPPKGKRIQLSLLEGSSDTWKATVVDQPAPQNYAPSQTTWDNPQKNRVRRDVPVCTSMPVSLLRRLLGKRDKVGEGGNLASRVESVMQSNLRNAQGLETGGRLAGTSEPANPSLHSSSSGEVTSSQARNSKNSGGQGLVGRWLTKMRRGESSLPAPSSVSPLNVLALDRKIDSASKTDPAGYSFICYRAAFNDAKQAGVIDALQHEWLTNSVAKRGSNGEIIDSPHYREVFGLQNKMPMTKFEDANINESGFMHLGKRQPNGSVVYEHAVYVHVVGVDIYLYQVNGSSFIVALNGADGPNKHNNIGKNVSKSHYKHSMDAGRIASFNDFFESKAGGSSPQPVFAFTPASDVRSEFARKTALANGGAVNSLLHPNYTGYRTKENLIASGSIGKVYKNGDRLMKDYTGFYDANHPGRLQKAENNVKGLNRLYGEGASSVILRDTDVPFKKQVSVDMIKVPGQSLASILSTKNVALAREISALYRNGGLVENLVGRLRTNGIIWNDINLANIMYDSKTKSFNLIDFDDAHINDLNVSVNDGQAERMSSKFRVDFADFERQTIAMDIASVQPPNNVGSSGKRNPSVNGGAAPRYSEKAPDSPSFESSKTSGSARNNNSTLDTGARTPLVAESPVRNQPKPATASNTSIDSAPQSLVGSQIQAPQASNQYFNLASGFEHEGISPFINAFNKAKANISETNTGYDFAIDILERSKVISIEAAKKLQQEAHRLPDGDSVIRGVLEDNNEHIADMNKLTRIAPGKLVVFMVGGRMQHAVVSLGGGVFVGNKNNALNSDMSNTPSVIFAEELMREQNGILTAQKIEGVVVYAGNAKGTVPNESASSLFEVRPRDQREQKEFSRDQMILGKDAEINVIAGQTSGAVTVIMHGSTFRDNSILGITDVARFIQRRIEIELLKLPPLPSGKKQTLATITRINLASCFGAYGGQYSVAQIMANITGKPVRSSLGLLNVSKVYSDDWGKVFVKQSDFHVGYSYDQHLKKQIRFNKKYIIPMIRLKLPYRGLLSRVRRGVSPEGNDIVRLDPSSECGVVSDIVKFMSGETNLLEFSHKYFFDKSLLQHFPIINHSDAAGMSDDDLLEYFYALVVKVGGRLESALIDYANSLDSGNDQPSSGTSESRDQHVLTLNSDRVGSIQTIRFKNNNGPERIDTPGRNWDIHASFGNLRGANAKDVILAMTEGGSFSLKWPSNLKPEFAKADFLPGTTMIAVSCESSPVRLIFDIPGSGQSTLRMPDGQKLSFTDKDSALWKLKTFTLLAPTTSTGRDRYSAATHSRV